MNVKFPMKGEGETRHSHKTNYRKSVSLCLPNFRMRDTGERFPLGFNGIVCKQSQHIHEGTMDFVQCAFFFKIHWINALLERNFMTNEFAICSGKGSQTAQSNRASVPWCLPAIPRAKYSSSLLNIHVFGKMPGIFGKSICLTCSAEWWTTYLDFIYQISRTSGTLYVSRLTTGAAGRQVSGGTTSTAMGTVVRYLVSTSFVVIESTAFTLEALMEQTEQHLATEITKCWRFVRMDQQWVGPDLHRIRWWIGCEKTNMKWMCERQITLIQCRLAN